MRVGVLETGAPPADLQPRFGRYPAMMQRMLGPAFSYGAFNVFDNPPPRPDACDAWVITGSSAGVYEGASWIAAVEQFLRAAKGRVPLIGICFGHQIMAQAFGGLVEKSARGWCAGLHTYRVTHVEPWMDPAETIAVAASHQDQVVAPPPNARLIAASAFTPFAGFAYTDQPAISFQCHPEFEPAYAGALYETRRGGAFDDATTDRAIASLAGHSDRALVAGWLQSFLAGRAGG